MSVLAMKNQYISIFCSACAGLFLFACRGGNDLSKNPPAAAFQQLPGNTGNCIIYIPYRYSDFGGSLSGSLTAAQVPGGSASIKGSTNWGFVPYAGKCAEPSTWHKMANVGSDVAKPSPSAAAKPNPSPSKKEKSASLAAKANVVGLALVAANTKASSVGKPEVKNKAESLIAESASFYTALDKIVELRPYKGNKMPAEKVISALRKATVSSPGRNGAPAFRAAAVPSVKAEPEAISAEADKLTGELTSLP